MLDTLGGPLVVSLGIGDIRGKKESEITGLPWLSIEERWERLCKVAERCLNRNFETYGATDKLALAEQLPEGVRVHVQRVSGEEFTPRPLARGIFSQTNHDFIKYSIQNSFTWVVLAQGKTELNQEYLNRLTSTIKLRESLTEL